MSPPSSRAWRSSTSPIPSAPARLSFVTFDGRMNDVEDVVVGSTNASLFAYVADGRNGMKVLQLTSPGEPAQFLRLLARARARADRLGAHPLARARASPRASTATAPSTRPAARSRCSAGSARARSTAPSRNGSSSTAAACLAGQRHRHARGLGRAPAARFRAGPRRRCQRRLRRCRRPATTQAGPLGLSALVLQHLDQRRSVSVKRARTSCVSAVSKWLTSSRPFQQWSAK